MSPEAVRGAVYVAIIIAASVGISLLATIFSIASDNQAAAVRGGIRLLLNIGGCYFLWAGYGWARKTFIVLYFLGGVIGFVGGMFLWGTEWQSTSVVSLALGTVYLLCGVALLMNSDIKKFAEEQRAGNFV